MTVPRLAAYAAAAARDAASAAAAEVRGGGAGEGEDGAADGDDAAPVDRRLADAADEDGGGGDGGAAAPPSGRPRRDGAPASVAAAGLADAVAGPAGGVADARSGCAWGAPRPGRRVDVDDLQPPTQDDGMATVAPGRGLRGPTKQGRGALIVVAKWKGEKGESVKGIQGPHPYRTRCRTPGKLKVDAGRSERTRPLRRMTALRQEG